MGYHKHFFACLTLFISTHSPAQTNAFDAALAMASEMLGSHTTLLVDATGHLVFVHCDNYDVARKDRIALNEIDEEAIALGSNGTILIACHEGRPRCARSIIYSSDQEVRSSVLRIPAPADTSQANSAVAAIRSILRNSGDVAGLRNETSTSSLRSNGTQTTATP